MGVDCKFVGYVYVGLNLVWFKLFYYLKFKIGKVVEWLIVLVLKIDLGNINGGLNFFFFVYYYLILY